MYHFAAFLDFELVLLLNHPVYCCCIQ